nr:histone H2A-Bbd type 2/3-like [Manis javanica]
MSHVECILQEGHYVQHMSPSMPVFLAAVIQYLTAKVLELAGNKAQTQGSRCITPEIVAMMLHSNRLLSSCSERLPSHMWPQPGSSLLNTTWVPGPGPTGTRSAHSQQSPRLAGALGKVVDI